MLKITKIFLISFSIIIFLIGFSVLPKQVQAANTSGSAWSDAAGSIDFSGVTVSESGLTGTAFGDAIGEVDMTGVSNDGSGNLSGNAQSAAIGLISFNAVSIDSNGNFIGNALSDAVGEIDMSGVNTTWRVFVNTPPSSRLVAGGEIAGANQTKSITITQGDSLTFSGMVWDCDDVSDIQSKEHNLPGTAWSAEAEDTEEVMNCLSGEQTFYPIANTETFNTIGVFDRYISVSDSEASSTSTIQVTVQEPASGVYWSFATGTEPCVCDDWVNQGCGAGSCAENELWFTRNCMPDLCDIEAQCLFDAICEPEVIEPLIPQWREVLPKF